MSSTPPLRKTFRIMVSLDTQLQRPDNISMTWTTPQIEEISLGCEINSYASAEI